MSKKSKKDKKKKLKESKKLKNTQGDEMFDIFKKNEGTETGVKERSKTPGIIGKPEPKVQKTGTKKRSFWQSKKTKPIVGKDPETLSVVLYNQSTLDEIARICKPAANASEFQVHFRGVQYVIEKPNSNKRLVFTIPTVFFNMPQKVTAASVDFNLNEVAEISEQVAPISLELAKEFHAHFPLPFFEAQGFKVTARELEMGSIHRHPGDFGFSATDLDNQVEKPGVIFRNLGCEDKIQVDSVMYLPYNQSVKIVVTETRGVTVSPLEDGGIEGQYLETPTISYIIQDEVQRIGFEEFFGGVSEDKTEIEYKVDQKWVGGEYPQIKEIFNAFLSEFKYEPMLIIDPELIEQEVSYYNYRNKYKSDKTNKARKNTYNVYDTEYYNELDDDDDYLSWAYDVEDDFEDETRLPSGTTKKERDILTRPPWRKTQTLGKLRVHKIDLKQYPDIDGSTSHEDIISIATAMKEAGYTDIEIRNLFRECEYPNNALEMYYADSVKPSKTDPK